MRDLTVVIPVFNQAFQLSLTLNGFFRQVPPFNRCPIIVVDNGSNQPIEAICEAYSEDLDVTYIRVEKKGRALARNLGAKDVKKGLLVFCDSDRIPRPEFLKSHYSAFKKHGDAITVGQVREMYVANPEINREKVLQNYLEEKRDRVPQFCQIVYSLFDNRGKTNSNVAWVSTLSGNLSIPAPIFHKLGGFDEKFQEWGFEHHELGYRAFLGQVPFIYEKGAINVHIAHPRSSNSYKDYMQKSHDYFVKKHPVPVINNYLSFMLGEINISDLENSSKVNKQTSIKDRTENFVKITNF
ncbi:glycosyltransferase family 2 protein [Cytobacillus pseudoceanisediminis]|uniref:glycosyltransferase family 2 protein n=1 Tax=Cytobacillus pseudoceanisediminis TaxID=3051614 RepID=UPI003C2EC8CE